MTDYRGWGDVLAEAGEDQVEAEGEVGGVAGRAVDGAGARGLEVGLLVGGVAEHEVQQRARGDPGQLGTEAGLDEDVLELDARRLRPQPEGVHGRDQLGAVPVGQHRVAQLGADHDHPVLPAGRRAGPRAPTQQLVGDRGQQRLLVGEVVVERARLHPELGADPAHRQVAEAVRVQQRDRALDDVVAVVAHGSPHVDGPRHRP